MLEVAAGMSEAMTIPPYMKMDYAEAALRSYFLLLRQLNSFLVPFVLSSPGPRDTLHC